MTTTPIANKTTTGIGIINSSKVIKTVLIINRRVVRVKKNSRYCNKQINIY